MRPIHGLVLAAALLAPSMAAGQSSPLPSEVRLTDAEKERVLEEAAARKREQSASQAEPAGPRMHGEVGFAIGTGGYRSAYGTAVVPLEGDGVAILSLGSTDFGKRGRYLEPWWR